MKLFAHRGASRYREENTVESLTFAADMGADAVECDVTRLKDGSYVIYHDETLARLAGADIRLQDIGQLEMRERLAAVGRHLTTFDEMIEGYDRHVPILLHVKMETLDADFVSRLQRLEKPMLFGAVSVSVVRSLRELFPPERILAFMPGKRDYRAFYEAGAGNIRLWENWLSEVTLTEVKAACPGAEIWIMANDGHGDFSGSVASLEKCQSLGADAYLLDDTRMAVDWRNSHGNV